ncbi:metalloregulator ArsR/SmtB family transcription factor [Paenibacillus xylanexedens]|uniref:ArsR/SmtB family transcription factor n=1 Tax=Paenibacillus sp. FSL R7-0272 TaxID=2921679 RepID=UPI0021C03560|nr:metalloregulator ArsR/SmtB family transcription factor [Paenibacillus xylanexedens]
MPVEQQFLNTIATEFKNNQKVLNAIGDETRQALLLALIQGPQKTGMRVGEIRVQTHLSRPAVSHHLKILKDAQIISVHKEGTRNFYRLDAGSKLKSLKNLASEIDKLFEQCEEPATESRSRTNERDDI